MEPRYIARNLFLIFFSESGNTVKSSTDAPGEKKNGSRHLSPNDRKYFRSASPIRFDFRCKTRESPQKRVSGFFFRFSKTFRKRWSYVVSFFSLFFDFRSIFCFFFPYFFPFFLQFRPLLVCFSLFFICELLKLNDYGRHLLCTLLLLLNLTNKAFLSIPASIYLFFAYTNCFCRFHSFAFPFVVLFAVFSIVSLGVDCFFEFRSFF